MDGPRALGREALGLQLDILSRASIDRAIETVLTTWGRVDVLVNNAIYQGPGLMYRFDDFTQEQLDGALLVDDCFSLVIDRFAEVPQFGTGSG